MNKTMICIELLQLLSTGKLINKNELAETLEINPRNIPEYIKTLRESGYDIISEKGKYGGYKLNKDFIIPTLQLNEKELSAIQTSISYLQQQSDYLDYNTYLKGISKILSTSTSISEKEEITIIDRYPLIMPKTELLKRYNIFKEAMDIHKTCKIEYLSTHNKLKKHIIHPYKVFVFNGSWFVLAWNETVNDFGYFKLNRIENIEITDERYSISKIYNESDYIDEFGMKQNGEFYNIKLELTDLYTVVSERYYGKDQVITKIDEHKTILECKMQNKSNIKTFVLGFGKKVKVLEPEWLKETIIKEAEAIISNNQ